MLFKRTLSNKGMTLIELLTVVVILGIIGSVAVLLIQNVIQKAKDQAFVANAVTLRDAGTFYVQEKLIHDETPENIISYKTLFREDFIEKIKDPDTGKLLDPEKNETYIVVNGTRISAVCFKGEARSLCSRRQGEKLVEEAVPIEDLSTELIQSF